MKRALLWKSVAVGALALGLLIPLSMIEGQIQARSRRQEEVKADIAALVAGRQQIIGPLLVLQYQVDEESQVIDPATQGVRRVVAPRDRQRVLVPQELDLQGVAQVDERHRGLFKAQAYDLAAQLKGTFVLPPRFGFDPATWAKVHPGRATLVLGLSDPRGIQKRPVLQWEGRALDFLPGPGACALKSAVHAELGDMAALEGRTFRFALPLALKGSQDLSFAPVAESTRVNLRSAWPCPSFQGKFSAQHKEGPEGFEATWEVFHLARSLEAILGAEGFTKESFGVAFLEPVNIYLRSERAVKYGFLFVGLTFSAFSLFEILRRLAIHPIQYLLVGLALAFFFLLLISLSERIPFHLAYLAASGACLGLLGVYLRHVLRSNWRGWGFAGGLGLVYAALYALLVSEDNALLIGSLLLFLGLGAVMVGTRKLDWYALTEDRKDDSLPAGG